MDSIMSSSGYAASQRYARELEERFNVSFKEELRGNGLPVAALVSIEEGVLVKRIRSLRYIIRKSKLSKSNEKLIAIKSLFKRRRLNL